MSLSGALRRRLVGEVRALFNDSARGETPVASSDTALLPRGSVAWRVHGDVTSMMIGGVTALLLQMLHPAAAHGVAEHSNFRADMLGRLRRTARFIAQTTYAERSEAEAAIAHVRAIHSRVGGTLPDGSAYRADDPRLLAWVHVAGALPFLDSWIRFGEPLMRRSDQDRYFAETAAVARALGADPVPTSRAEAEALLNSFRPQLRLSAAARDIARVLMTTRPYKPTAWPAQALATQAAIDLLPDWARRMHGLRASGLARPLVTGTAFGVAGTLRWAFSGNGR